jgi:SMI1 / KNR4 family (SUKH-1)
MNEAIRLLVNKIQEVERAHLAPASADGLKRAQDAGFPAELLELYRECDPPVCIELKHRIWSIDNALVENQGAVPGCGLFPHGFIVFASTMFGDAYCIDKNVTNQDGQHPVVLFSHEMIGEDSTLSEIQSLRVEVATSLSDFLLKFVDGTLIEEPSFE